MWTFKVSKQSHISIALKFRCSFKFYCPSSRFLSLTNKVKETRQRGCFLGVSFLLWRFSAISFKIILPQDVLEDVPALVCWNWALRSLLTPNSFITSQVTFSLRKPSSLLVLAFSLNVSACQFQVEKWLPSAWGAVGSACVGTGVLSCSSEEQSWELINLGTLRNHVCLDFLLPWLS